MRKLNYHIFSIMLIGLFSFGLHFEMNAQACNYFHRRNCIPQGELQLKENAQSRSALFSKGQKSDFNMVAHANQDYRVTICADMIFDEPLELKIYEKVRVRITDAKAAASSSSVSSDDDVWESDNYETESSSKKEDPQYKIVKKLLYDNTQDDLNQSVEFTATTTKSLIVQVKAPGEASEFQLKLSEVGCVGVLIEQGIAGSTGF